jgi:hypothetical protein
VLCAKWQSRRRAPGDRPGADVGSQTKGRFTMAKKSRGGRMTAAKARAAKVSGGKGLVKNRKAGKRIMST